MAFPLAAVRPKGLALPLINPALVSAVKYWLDAGTIVGVSNNANIAASDWVDGSANAKGALGTAVAMKYKTDGGQGRPAVEFDGSTSYGVTPSITLAQPLRIFAVIKQIARGTAHRFIDGNNNILVNQNGQDPGIGMAAGSSLANMDNTLELGYWGLADITFNGASSSFRVNANLTKTGSAGASGFSSEITLGAAFNQSAGFFTNFQLAELMLCDSTLSAGDATRIRAYLTQKHQLTTRNGVICDGDSLTFGQGSTAGNDYPSVLQTLLPGGTGQWQKFNGGTTGESLPDMDSNAATTVDLFNNAVAYLIGWGGTNDLKGGASFATLQSRWITYFTNRGSAGWMSGSRRLVAVTIIARSNFTGQNNTDAASFNTWLRANYATYATHLLDLAADSRFQNYSDTTYYDADGVHLNNTGYATVAALAATLITASL